MANAITVGRLVLLFVVVWLIHVGNVGVIETSMILIILVFGSDGVDGWVARKRNSTSTFGAVFDIAGDRIVENVLWVVFADLNLIPVWIPLMVLTRGFIVDALRSLHVTEGTTSFGGSKMMRSAFTEWLTAGRFMRAFYGYAKAAGFVFLTGLAGDRRLDTSGTALGTLYGWDWFHFVGWFCVWAAVALTVIRGLPVIYDSLAYIREVDRRDGGPKS
ncbi:MAG TPA: CDP-alcohol phosphatidyltransferase family protein [Thermomicrobiales bacterium]|nr:CDP-alcohol phosphatidyltransferase family protein [Thermomicrobiales bacterium]